MYTVKYLVKRVLIYLLTLFSSLLINFVVPRLIPGNPVQAKLAQLYRQGVNLGGKEFIEKFSRLFYLDQPIHLQFLNYLKNLLHGNLGLSITYFPSTVEEMIWRSLPWSIGLLVAAVTISFVGGLFLGAFMGWRKSEEKGLRWTSIIFSVFVVLSQMPFYILGIMLVYLLAFLFPLFPYGGGVDLAFSPGSIGYFVSILKHATLPALSIVLVWTGGWALEARGLMVSVLGEDYLFFAEAKGLHKRDRFRKYALRNTVVPLMTDLAIALGTVAAGSLITEIVFSYPGLGSLMYSAVQQLDYPMIQGISLVVIFGVTTAALLVDLIYPLLDPRVGEK